MHKLTENEIIGAVKLNDKWSFYAGITAEWILDYKSFDPDYNPECWDYIFRNNLLVVNESNANAFCDAMKKYELTIEDIQMNKMKNIDLTLSILIDFDTKFYVNGYYDLLLEEYIPENWNGIFDNPLKYVPDHVRQIFE